MQGKCANVQIRARVGTWNQSPPLVCSVAASKRARKQAKQREIHGLLEQDSWTTYWKADMGTKEIPSPLHTGMHTPGPGPMPQGCRQVRRHSGVGVGGGGGGGGGVGGIGRLGLWISC